MDILIIVGQFFLSLSILVILHELGHFIPAKLFGTRVEKFYLFFDAGFALFKTKRGETEYGIGWLPLGGYVKISGMVDESLDMKQLEEEPQPWEFRSKPTWQRLIIMLGGVFVNFILGFFIFGMMLWRYGEQYIPAKNVTYGIQVDSLGGVLGLKDGDHILRIGDVAFEKFDQGIVKKEIIINNPSSLTIERAGTQMDLAIPNSFIQEISQRKYQGVPLFYPRLPFIIDSFSKDSPGEKSGLKPKDRIVGVDNVPTPFFYDFLREIKGKNNIKVDLSVIRNMDTISIPVVTSKAGKIGAYHTPIQSERKTYNLAEALPLGVAHGVDFLSSQVKAFGQMFKGNIKAKEGLGGFRSIAKLFPTTWQWPAFWRITAILSLILGFMNLLPIPALDGGHVMFLLYEMISGRKPSDKFLEYATMAGFALVICLLLYANGLDIWRWWNGE